jgi:hypothetical protein
MSSKNKITKFLSFDTLCRFTPEIILFVYAVLFFSIRQPNQVYNRVIISDGKAYYAYLTAIFIYHDLDYNFVEDYEEKYYPADRSQFKEFRFIFNGETVNKAFPGLAFLLLPFFLLAHVIALLSGLAADGYSPVYQYTMGIGALFYFWVGLRFLKSLLASFSFQKKVVPVILILVAFGTNIIYYTINEGMMTHVYNFMLITLFLLSVRKAFSENGKRWLIRSALVLGLITAVRPTNLLVILLLPFLADSTSQITAFFKKIFSDWKVTLSVSMVFLVFPFAVLLLWKLQTGYWFVYSYGNEGFDFLHPHFIDILFSFNKGWFVYTPLAAIALLGLTAVFRKNKIRFFSTLVFMLIYTYVASSWWVWHYTSNFGQRIFIDVYGLMAVLLGFFLQQISKSKILKAGAGILLLVIVIINCLQYYQHYKYIFPPGTIDSSAYRDSFLRLVPAPRVNFPEELIEGTKVFYNDFEKDYGWLNYASVTDKLAFEGKYASRAGFVNQYSIGLYEPLPGQLSTSFGWVKVGFRMYSNQKYSDALLVVDFESEGKSIFYKPIFMKEYNIGDQWVYLEFAVKVPKLHTPDDMLRVYFILDYSEELFLIDNLKVEVISLKEDFEFY